MLEKTFYAYRGGSPHPMGKTLYCCRYIPGLEIAVFLNEEGVEFTTFVGSTSSMFGQTTNSFDIEAAIKQSKKMTEEGTVTPKKRS